MVSFPRFPWFVAFVMGFTLPPGQNALAGAPDSAEKPHPGQRMGEGPDGTAQDEGTPGEQEFQGKSPVPRIGEEGFVAFRAPKGNFVRWLRTTLEVPPKPPPQGTLFLWPGLQPARESRNFLPIDNGVLQPVLTWGPTCAPFAPGGGHPGWWISAQYVNTFGAHPGFTGCQGGPGMMVDVGDKLDLTMTLVGGTWHQKVTVQRTGDSVEYAKPLGDQDQMIAEFVIEPVGALPVSEVVFTASIMAFAEPAPCVPSVRGPRDEYSPPIASKDGRLCTVERIVLRKGR